MSAIWKGGWQEKFTNDIDMGSAHVQSIHNLQVRLHNYLILQEYVLKIKAVTIKYTKKDRLLSI